MNILAFDPGCETGVALYSGKLLLCKTLHYGGLGEEVKALVREIARTFRVDLVAVEVPRAGAAAFGFRLRGQSPASAAMIARNVGACAAKAEAIAGFCEGLGLKVVRKEPASGGTKRQNPLPIWRARFPEWKARTSQHARDAALLAERVWKQEKFSKDFS